jgi:hypothetical protein
MPLQRIQRSEIWLVDLGYLGKLSRNTRSEAGQYG